MRDSVVAEIELLDSVGDSVEAIVVNIVDSVERQIDHFDSLQSAKRKSKKGEGGIRTKEGGKRRRGGGAEEGPQGEEMVRRVEGGTGTFGRVYEGGGRAEIESRR